MWLRRVEATRGLRVGSIPRASHASSRACTALLSPSRFLAQAQATATIPSTTIRYETTQQQKIKYTSSLRDDMRDARQLLSEKFGVHSLYPDEEILLERLLTGQDVLLQMTHAPRRRTLQLVSVHFT